jgi:hypothetical protein
VRCEKVDSRKLVVIRRRMTRRLSHAETQAFWHGIRLGCHCEGRLALKQSLPDICHLTAHRSRLEPRTSNLAPRASNLKDGE